MATIRAALTVALAALLGLGYALRAALGKGR